MEPARAVVDDAVVILDREVDLTLMSALVRPGYRWEIAGMVVLQRQDDRSDRVARAMNDGLTSVHLRIALDQPVP